MLTSPIPSNPIHKLIITALKHTPVARLANPIVCSMPRAPNFIADFPFLLVFADSDNGADDFMAGNAGEGCARVSSCKPQI
jgi:hypothetical protein